MSKEIQAKAFLDEVSPIAKMDVLIRRDQLESFHSLIKEILADEDSFYQCTACGPASAFGHGPKKLAEDQLKHYSFWILYVDLESAARIRTWVRANE